MGKFNRAFGETLKEPEELILDSVGVVPGTDGEKMSKSYGNTIPLFGTTEEIEKAVMSIVTDSEGDMPEHVYNIHKVIRSEEELRPIYEEHKGRYGDLKKILLADLEAIISPMRKKRESITEEQVKSVLADGFMRAKEVSGHTMKKVRRAVGVEL